MALPSIQEVRAVAVAWFKAPGRPPRLAVLRARLAQLVTDPRCAVHARIAPGAPPSLVVEVARWNLDGSPRVPVTLTWTPDGTELPGSDLDDVIEDDGGKNTRRQRAAQANGGLR